MQCIHCGSVIDDDSIFCTQCGNYVRSATATHRIHIARTDQILFEKTEVLLFCDGLLQDGLGNAAQTWCDLKPGHHDLRFYLSFNKHSHLYHTPLEVDRDIYIRLSFRTMWGELDVEVAYAPFSTPEPEQAAQPLSDAAPQPEPNRQPTPPDGPETNIPSATFPGTAAPSEPPEEPMPEAPPLPESEPVPAPVLPVAVPEPEPEPLPEAEPEPAPALPMTVPEPKPEPLPEPAPEDHAPTLPIRTERLILRPFRSGDTDALHRISNEPEILRWMPDWEMPPQGTAHVIEFFQSQYAQATPTLGRVMLAITLPSGELIGMVGIGNKEQVDNEIEIAYFLTASQRGNGYMAEAATALSRWALRELGVPRLIAIVEPDNLPSQRVVERAGFLRREMRMLVNDGDTQAKPFFLYRLDAEIISNDKNPAG